MSQASSSQQGVTTHGASFIATSVNHPQLVRTDAESIRIFLNRYDQYSKEVKARAQQLNLTGSTTTEAVRPVNLKYCVDPEYIESVIALDILSVDSYDELSDETLRQHLEEKAEESIESINL